MSEVSENGVWWEPVCSRKYWTQTAGAQHHSST